MGGRVTFRSTESPAGGIFDAAMKHLALPLTLVGCLLGSALGSARAADPLAVPAAKPAAAAAAAPAKPSGPVPPEKMEGLDFSGLSAAQKTLVIAILNEHGCDCSCGMKLAVCRRDDSTCTRSLALSKQVIDMAKQGKSREEIVKSALTPPSKFVQFPIAPGDAPATGPKDAKVTILFYLDYQ